MRARLLCALAGFMTLFFATAAGADDDMMIKEVFVNDPEDPTSIVIVGKGFKSEGMPVVRLGAIGKLKLLGSPSNRVIEAELPPGIPPGDYLISVRPKGEDDDDGVAALFTIGAVGPSGEKGEKGDKGDLGPTGSKGDKGDTGERGPAGTDGKDGIDGAPGRDGLNGANGLDGANCYDGIGDSVADCIGPKGDKGDKGDRGNTGPQGEQGLPGPTGAFPLTYTVRGSVTITPIYTRSVHLDFHCDSGDLVLSGGPRNPDDTFLRSAHPVPPSTYRLSAYYSGDAISAFVGGSIYCADTNPMAPERTPSEDAFARCVRDNSVSWAQYDCYPR